MKKRIANFPILLMISLAFFLTISCDSGGGGDSETPSDIPDVSERTYHLRDDGYFEPGYIIAFFLSGSDDQGNNWTAEFTLNTKNKTQLNNAAVTPQELLIVMTIENMAPSTSLATTYYNQNYQPIQMFDSSTGITYTPTTNPILPETAQIGEVGSLPNWLGDDNSTTTGYWMLKQGSGVLAKFTQYVTIKDDSGTTISIAEMAQAIDESGDPKSMTYKISLVQLGVTVTLSGNRTI